MSVKICIIGAAVRMGKNIASAHKQMRRDFRL